MKTGTTQRILVWSLVLGAFAATMFICGAASAMDLQDKLNAGISVSLDNASAALPAVTVGTKSDGYGIPAGMHGSLSSGRDIYEISCAACHPKPNVLPATSFHGFKRRMATGAMDGMELSDQEVADVVMWLNRFDASATPVTEVIASTR